MGRKQKTIHYLYKTTCKVTGKYYIGMHSTCNLEDGYLGSGKRLRYSIRKYGKENHVKEILEFFDCREALVEGEKKMITEADLCNEHCMNLMSGGTGGFSSAEHMNNFLKVGSTMSIVNKDKIVNRKNWLWKNDINWSSNYSQQMKNNSVGNKSWTNKRHSEESKNKIRKSLKNSGAGETNSQFGTMWITNGVENRKIKKDNVIPEGWYKGRI